jgi:glyoxylase I family protein
MSSPLFRALHHVALICSDYERSKHFYSQVLGFRIIHEVYRADRASHKLDLEISPTQHLELFSFPSPPARPTRPEACGLRHLAFAVQDIEKTLAELRARGVESEEVRVDPVTGQRFTFFRDPDDLPIEIYEQDIR